MWKKILLTAFVWIAGAVGNEIFPKWGFQFMAGMFTGMIWATWLKSPIFGKAKPSGHDTEGKS